MKEKVLQKMTFEEMKKYVKTMGPGNYTIRGLARNFNCDRKTIRKYLDLIEKDQTPYRDDVKYRPAEAEINAYKNVIINKLDEGVRVKFIYNFLVEKHDVKFSYQSLTRWVRMYWENEKHLKGTQSKLIIETSARRTSTGWLEREYQSLFEK